MAPGTGNGNGKRPDRAPQSHSQPPAPTQLLFVDGPSLGRGGDAKSRSTRSALIRRLISEKQTKYRQEEAARREQLIAQRQARNQTPGQWTSWYPCRCQTQATTAQAPARSRVLAPVRDQDQETGIGAGRDRSKDSQIHVAGEGSHGAAESQSTREIRGSPGDAAVCGTCGGLLMAPIPIRTTTSTSTSMPEASPATGIAPATAMDSSPNQTDTTSVEARLPLAVARRMDPFSPVDPSLAPSLDSLVHHSLTSIWPGFRQMDFARRCYQSWILPTRQNKLMLYSTLWGASCHRDVLRISHGSNPVLETRDQLYYKGRVLQMLRDHVVDFASDGWRDGIIMAILFLAVNETSRREIVRDPSPFTPPFANMQNLDFYGSRDYHSLHWAVICNLLRRLGGLGTIQVYGLAWLVSISDLMNAAHALTKPLFRPVDAEGRQLAFTSPLHVFPIPMPTDAEEPGRGFRHLRNLCPPVKQGTVRVFIQLSEFSALVQWYARRRLDPVSLDLLADVRNHVHHALFSLPDEHDPLEDALEICDLSPDDASISHGLYLSCRLAALLYGTHVTFPVPRSALLRAAILPKLAAQLDQIQPVVASPVLLWCAVVAAIAAEGMPEHEALVCTVDRVCRELDVGSEAQLTEIVQTFAWVDVACTEGCSRLWKAVQSLETER